ncbi:MAG: hypothetical protein NWT02_11100 [Opitutales bacterium]|jgi:hypothetical protein|nr:hypothetical protein [Opitutales bacterium]MDP4643498.1 hypothetical protein [Opitutales bacterium]MDP4694440.1 hypothetical protein [Opitutales bacterium]MDP4778139.1 hypothetical protein [Opitutales bacterium]MDP4883226.1 hypothetical protein [Opitutales bacterium]
MEELPTTPTETEIHVCPTDDACSSCSTCATGLCPGVMIAGGILLVAVVYLLFKKLFAKSSKTES